MMKNTLRLVVLSAVLCRLMIGTDALAQSLYKWVDAQGRVSYSDRPAPPDQSVKDLSASLNTMGAGEAQTAPLAYEAQQIISKSPVTLYAAKGCPPCDEGRILLRKRGVPYSEKLIETESDSKALQELFNVQTLPVLSVGSNTRRGYSSVDWEGALDAAGYAKDGKLPKGFATGKVEKLTAPAGSNAAVSNNEANKRAVPQSASPSAEDINKPSLKF